MNTLIFPATTSHKNAFLLVPNVLKVGYNRILYFYIIVLIPLLLISSILYNMADLGTTGLSVAVIATFLALVNLYFFYIRYSNQQESLTLSFDSGEVILLKNGQVLSRAEINQIDCKQLNWGMGEEDCLPAIKLQGERFPKLSIGCVQPGMHWKDLQTSIDFTDFLVPSEKEWTQLLMMLNKPV